MLKRVLVALLKIKMKNMIRPSLGCVCFIF